MDFTTPPPYRPPNMYVSPQHPREAVYSPRPRPYRPPMMPRRLNFDMKLNLPFCDGECECTICFDDDIALGMLPCGHAFHTNCITQWFMKGKTTCPNCRKDIDIDTISNK